MPGYLTVAFVIEKASPFSRFAQRLPKFLKKFQEKKTGHYLAGLLTEKRFGLNRWARASWWKSVMNTYQAVGRIALKAVCSYIFFSFLHHLGRKPLLKIF